jgi:hypothetical protein
MVEFVGMYSGTRNVKENVPSAATGLRIAT